MKRLQIISVAMVLVLSPQFLTTAKAEVTKKIHLKWAIDAKIRAFAQFYTIGIRDAFCQWI